jgi:hypothetical protein
MTNIGINIVTVVTAALMTLVWCEFYFNVLHKAKFSYGLYRVNKGKKQSCPCLIKHHTTKMYRGVEI